VVQTHNPNASTPNASTTFSFSYGIGRKASGNRIQHLVIYPELGSHPTSPVFFRRDKVGIAMRKSVL
jgi:hypothetical protein